MISNIRVIHICPESNGCGKVLPHALVFPDTFLTLGNKWRKTVFFNLFLAIQSKQLLYFKLHRKSMCIPACFSRNHVALHGTVSGNHILDNTGQNVTDVRFAISGWRSVIKGIGLAFFAIVHTLLENIIFTPEFFYFFFSFHKIQVCRYFLIHLSSSLIYISEKIHSKNHQVIFLISAMFAEWKCNHFHDMT